MFEAAYQKLAEAISAAGFHTNGLENCGSWQRTTVCSMRLPDGRFTGNSFWVTQLASGWYLGVWGGYIYKLPDGYRIDKLCVSWLTREPVKTSWDFDDALKKDFDLVPVTDEEFDKAIRTA